MSDVEIDPLFGDEPDRVHLERAPLVRVLAQVRFPKILKISDDTHIADFQEQIRRDYPLFAKDQGQNIRD